MEYKLLKKGYKINLDKIVDGCYYSKVSCAADSRSKAKKKLLDYIIYDDWKHKYTDEIITYLTIPVVRDYEADQYDFEGKCLSKIRINEILSDRNRSKELDKILNDDTITKCYIKKYGSYYRSNYSGYTGDIHEAGVYEKEDAVKAAKSCFNLFIIPIDIKEHNDIINRKIRELEEKILKDDQVKLENKIIYLETK